MENDLTQKLTPKQSLDIIIEIDEAIIDLRKKIEALEEKRKYASYPLYKLAKNEDKIIFYKGKQVKLASKATGDVDHWIGQYKAVVIEDAIVIE